MVRNPTVKHNKYKYDFVLSFSGSDRDVVNVVKEKLRQHGLQVFYDYDEQHDLLGKDLTEHFIKIYQHSAKYCVIFISNSYIKKLWCRLERRAALSRAFRSRSEYIIPYYLKNVVVPSIPTTIGCAYLNETPPEKFASLLVNKIKMNNGVSRGANAIDQTNKFIRIIQQRMNAQEPMYPIDNPRHLYTGLINLDQALGDIPLKRGAIYAIAARPGMGKTSLALNIAHNLAQKRVSALYASLNLSSDNLAMRILTLSAEVPRSKLYYGDASSSELGRISKTVTRLSYLPINILNTNDNCEFDRLICHAYQMIKNYSASIIVFESLDLLHGSCFFGHKIRISPRSVLTVLDWLAKATNSCILMTCPIGRSVETRRDKRPMLKDFLGGKHIADHFEAVITIYRPVMYSRNRRYIKEKKNIDDMELYVFRPQVSKLPKKAVVYYYSITGSIKDSPDEW